MDPRMGTSFDLGSGTTGAFAVNTPAYLESRYRWLVAYQQDILKVSKEPTENASFAEVKADCLTDAQLVLQQHASGEMAEREALMSTVYGVSAKDVFMLCKSSSSSTNELETMMNAKLTVFFFLV